MGGIWDYTGVTPATTSINGGSAVITENGDFYYTVDYFPPSQTLFMGHLSSSGDALTGYQYASETQSVHSACGFPAPGYCPISAQESYSGTIAQRSTLSIATDQQSNLNFTYDSLYNQPSSLSMLAGEWQGRLAPFAEVGGLLLIKPSGSFTVANPILDCAINGQFSLINPSYNAYDVSFSATGADCELPGTSARGIATLRTGSLLEMAVTFYDASNTPQSATLYDESPVVQAGVWTGHTSDGGTAMMLTSPAPSINVDGQFGISTSFGDTFLETASSTCVGLYTAASYPQPGTTSGTYTLEEGATFNPATMGPTSGCAPASGLYELTATLVPNQTESMSITNNLSTNVLSTINFTFDPIYNEPANLAGLAGTWANADGSSITIQSDGSFTETNPASPYTGCTVTGRIYVIDPAHNMYAYEMTWASCPSGPGQAGQTVNGILTLNDAVTPNQLVGGGVSSATAMEQNLSVNLNVALTATRQ